MIRPTSPSGTDTTELLPCTVSKNTHEQFIFLSGLKWHKVSKETKDAFIAFHKQKLSVPKAQIEYEKVMIAEHGEEAWNRLSADRSICPDNKWAYNLWLRLNLVSRGSLNGPDAFIKAVESVKAYNEKHGKELATVHQKDINGRIEIYACVVDAFASRAHKLLPQAGDIIAVDATSSLDLQDTKLIRFVTCSLASGTPLGYICHHIKIKKNSC